MSVTVTPRRSVSIIVNHGQVAGGGTTTTSVTPTVSGGGSGPTYFAELADVDVEDLESGATAVYNANTSKYDIKKLTLADLDSSGNLDGGDF